MKKLLKYMKGYTKESIIAPLFKMLEACFELFTPIVTARIIDIGIKEADTSYIWGQCGILVALGVIGLVCSLTAQYFAAKAAWGFGTNLRKDLFRHINSLSYTELDMIGPATLVTRMTSDANQVQTGVNLFLRLFLRSPFIVVGAVVMALSISVKMTVIFLIAVPLIALVIFLIVKATIPIYKRVQTILDRVVLQTRENYVGARVVRAFSREEDEKEDFQETNQEWKQTQVYAGKISALMNPLTYVMVNLAIVAILVAGGREVDQGRLTQGEIIALINYMNQVLLALVVLANLVITVTKAWASAIRINEVLDQTSSMAAPEILNEEIWQTQAADRTGRSAPSVQMAQVRNPEQAEDLAEGVPSVVEFDHVDFAYAKAQALSLSDITFQAKKGQTIGIIGGTGAGKSTLVNLIPRFYDATGGCVSVEGVPVGNYPYEYLRRKIGIVPQKSVLFSGTIRDNMRWAKEDATDEEIWRALEIAQAKSFVEQKSGGLDEWVATAGRNFSGGQRQRLCIARALVGDPKILILDDSASALDFATDAALRKAIKENTKDMTTFIVSQRATTVQRADQILVLDEGELVGVGTHQELLASCEVYREICQSQLSKEEVAGA